MTQEAKLSRLLAAALVCAAIAAPVLARDEEPMTKIFVARDGVERLTDAALAAAGRAIADDEIDRVQLSLRGKPVPILVERPEPGSPDGRFALSFVGSAPHGEKTWDDPYVSENVYVLRSLPAGEKPLRIELAEGTAPRASAPAAAASPYTAHLEVNRELVRFSGAAKPEELWFWEEIKASDPAPKEVPVAIADPDAWGTVRLRVRFVGYSHLPVDPDHTVQVGWNGEPIGKAVWDGENPFVFEKELPAAKAKPENVLTLHALGETTNGIDLVLLDWVEVTYPRRHVLREDGQLPLALAPGEAARVSGASGAVTFFEVGGTHAWTVRPRENAAVFTSPAGAPSAARVAFIAALFGKSLVPRLAVTRPQDLRAPGLGADDVVITHAEFRDEAERLAAARRAQGLSVAVVDVQDVYDRFRDGFLDPVAIRDFLKYAQGAWKPSPRYVLLVGDASWDYKNTVVEDENYADWHWSAHGMDTPPKNKSNVTGLKGLRNDRLRIPTWQYQSPWGHAASDNFFVAFAGDDRAPEMAIGRLPVGTRDEAKSMIDKILGYDRLVPGSFRGALFITNDEEGFQRQTDILVDEAKKDGYDVQRVYPKKEEKDNAENTRALVRAFDEGKAFVLFNGHGGRYIWRTGPPDLAKNHDLFTLENLDELKPTPRLPVVVSLTCYSAPFDHPVADSIGEKLLRIPGRGAVAVVASSWRNAPPIELGRKMIELLGRRDGPRIGDAFLGAKKAIFDTIAIATYNLLGDPATPYRGPSPAAPDAPQPSPAAR